MLQILQLGVQWNRPLGMAVAACAVQMDLLACELTTPARSFIGALQEMLLVHQLLAARVYCSIRDFKFAIGRTKFRRVLWILVGCTMVNCLKNVWTP